MRVLVTISRDYADPVGAVSVLLSVINEGRRSPHERCVLVHGASHMDWLLAGAAIAWGHQHEPHPYIGRLGRAGGPVRNQEMVDAGADVCLAFIAPDSRGARDCARRAEDAGIRTIRFGAKEEAHG